MCDVQIFYFNLVRRIKRIILLNMWMAVFSEKGFMWLVDMSILCCWLFAKKSSGSYDV